MKRTKFFAAFLTLALIAGLGFGSCSNDDDEDSTKTVNTDTTDTDNSTEALESTAFNLLRILCSIDSDEDDMEELPENWESASYTIDEGAVIGEDEATVYSLPCYDADDALEYFSDLIGQPVSSDDLTNGTYKWTYSGLGSLTFTKDTTEDDSLFATITFDVPCLAGKITQLKFIDSETFASAASENSYKGKPYFGAGDIIKRKEKNDEYTYWMCVRPAGGNLLKDKSYWVCLNPEEKNIFTEKQESVTLYSADNKKVSKKWKLAKNLMSLKTAKAACHTFASIANTDDLWELDNANDDINTYLTNTRKIDLKTLAIMPDEFCFAYGSYTKDKKRTTSGKNQNAYTQYVQPFLIGKLSKDDDGNVKEEIATVRADTKTMYSATDNYDMKYANQIGIGTIYGDDADFDYSKFFQRTTDDCEFETCALIRQGEKIVAIASYHYYRITPYGNGDAAQGTDRHFIFFSPELCIKDNKGTASEAKNPLGSKYEVVYRAADNCTNWNWWDSLATTNRYVDGKLTDFTKENN